MINSADPDQPTDLDLHRLQRQGISKVNRTAAEWIHLKYFAAIFQRETSFAGIKLTS